MPVIERARGVFRRTPLGVRWAAVTGVALLGLAACSSSEPAGDVTRGASSDGDAIQVAMVEDQAFDPGTLNLTAGEEVTVEVTNDDSTAHDFAIESLDLNTGTVEANEVATATFTVPDEGVEFVCTFHPDMTGRIEVK
ncbi:MAG: cupredoxin domain-containing protein [Actinomycetota bacterium]